MYFDELMEKHAKGERFKDLFHVIFIDEYNNLYDLGYYPKLNDAIPDIN